MFLFLYIQFEIHILLFEQELKLNQIPTIFVCFQQLLHNHMVRLVSLIENKGFAPVSINVSTGYSLINASTIQREGSVIFLHLMLMYI